MFFSDGKDGRGVRPIRGVPRRELQTIVEGVIIVLIVSGCAVGPDYRSPAQPRGTSYTAATLPERTVASSVKGGASQRFIPGNHIPGQWWSLFHSEPLDHMIQQALSDSPSLALAKARIIEARENRRAQFGNLIPSVDANLSASRQKISGASFGQPGTDISPFTLLNATVDVSYSLDVFGATRRQLEALASQIEYQQFQLEGIYLALTANIVTTAIQEASLRSQIQATRQIISVLAQQLELIEGRFQLGAVPLSDVLAQRTQLAQTRATLPVLERDLQQTRHQLAVLIGKPPSEAVLPEFTFEQMSLPEELPLSLPSSLVRQRPDIRASEALLHAASAGIGVATARLYPQITLTGQIGSSATTLNGLFESGSTIWNLGAGLLQPIFRGGTLTAQRRAAIAQYDQAMAQYRDTVLQSFRNVADVLRALESDAQTLKDQAETESVAAESLDLTQRQFALGAVSYLSLLNAQRQHQEARIARVKVQATRYADTAALFQALGGGWWNRNQPEASLGAPFRE